MTSRTIQNALNWGEISPAFYGRTELPQYRAGCSTLRNMWVSPRGGAVSRGGLRFCGQSKQTASVDSTPPQLIPFIHDVSQSYLLEFGDFYMRVAFEAGYVLEDAFTVDTANNADPGLFTAAGNDFEVDDWVFFAGFEGMTEVNGQTYIVDTVPITGSFTLRNTLTDVTLSTVAFGTYIASSGTVARVFTLDTPYSIDDVKTLKWSQSADQMSLAHPLYKPHDLNFNAANDWDLVTTSFSASISAPAGALAVPSTTTSATVSTQYQYVVTAVDTLTSEESVASNVATVTNSVNIALTLGANTITWSPVTGAQYYNLYKAPAAYGGAVPVGSQFGYMATAFGLEFVDTNIVPDMTVVPPKHFNPFATSSIDYFFDFITGSGYTTSVTPPNVFVTDPTGLGFTGYGVVVAGGVYAIIPNNNGEGYTAPVVFIDDGGGGGSGAIIAAASSGFSSAIWEGGCNITNGGSSYDAPIATATWTRINGQTGSSVASSITVAGGVITAMSFPNPGGHTDSNAVLKSSVVITVQDGAGSGASASAHIGPSTGTFPSVVAYFNQRRFYAGTLNEPDTYWGSQPGAYANMDSSIPVTDGDALSGTPWAQQINGIQWMIPMPGGLVILTGLGAWQLNGGQPGAPLTPTDQNANAQAFNGVSPDVRPIKINDDIVYVQKENSIVRNLAYTVVSNIYTGTDLTVMSNHLFDTHTIERWDWANERHKVLWTVRDDGILLSLSWLKEQNVFAWARHDTRGLFESVAVVSESPVDAPYFMVKRYVDGHWVYYLERMDNRLWTTIEDAWCLDSAVAYPQTTPDAVLTASSATGDANIGSYDIIAGGTGYTAPTGTVVDETGSGTGATVLLTVTGGVITGATPVDEGAGYVAPAALVIVDATGSGAVIQPEVTNYVTVSASAAVFSSDNVGDIIRMGGGQLEVVEYVGWTEVVANVLSPITKTMPNDPDNMVLPAPSGAWTIATPTSTVSGLNHLEGMSVMALADGSVVAAQDVIDGAITLPAAASKILVGLPFTAQLQTLYLETPGGGTIQGRRKQAYDVVLRVEASRPPQVGSNEPDAAVQPNQANVPWTHMTEVQDRNPSAPAGQPIPLFTGDYFTNIAAVWDNNSQIAVQQTDPVPLTVLAIVPNVSVGDTPG